MIWVLSVSSGPSLAMCSLHHFISNKAQSLQSPITSSCSNASQNVAPGRWNQSQLEIIRTVNSWALSETYLTRNSGAEVQKFVLTKSPGHSGTHSILRSIAMPLHLGLCWESLPGMAILLISSSRLILSGKDSRIDLLITCNKLSLVPLNLNNYLFIWPPCLKRMKLILMVTFWEKFFYKYLFRKVDEVFRRKEGTFM